MKTTFRKHFLINKESKEKLPKDLLKILASKDALGLHKYLKSQKNNRFSRRNKHNGYFQLHF